MGGFYQFRPQGARLQHTAQCLSNGFLDQLALSERGPAGVELCYGEEMVELIDFICMVETGKTLPVYLKSFPQGSISSKLAGRGVPITTEMEFTPQLPPASSFLQL